MAKKKENLKGMGMNELKAKLITLEESIRSIHFKSEGAKSKNVKEVKTLRKEVARILTEMNRVKKEAIKKVSKNNKKK